MRILGVSQDDSAYVSIRRIETLRSEQAPREAPVGPPILNSTWARKFQEKEKDGCAELEAVNH